MLKKLFETHKSHCPEVSEREVEQYDAHFALLKEWNAKIALVSRKSIDQSFAPHYVDSVWISDFARKHHKEGETVHDLGTGAGFPGLIFAIRYPDIQVVVYEKLAKKRLFLEDAIAKLKLSNVTLAGGIPEERLKGLFLARAVLPVAELLPFMSKKMSYGSRLILNLGGDGEAPVLPADFKSTHSLKYELPLDFGFRRASCLLKVPRGT